MATLNKITCGTTEGGNTGIGDCPFLPKHFVGAIIGPVGFKLTAAELASTLLAALKTGTHAAKAARIYPIQNFKALDADNTEAPTKQTFGYGDQKFIREGKYALSFQHVDGGICLHKNLRKFNGTNLAAYFIDADGVLIGYKNGSDLQMIPLIDFYAQPMKLSAGSEVAKLLIDFQFKPEYLNELIGFVETRDEFNIDDVIGLEDVVLSVQTAINATGEVDIKLKTSCGGVDLYDLFKTNFTQLTAWIAKNKTTGAVITITAVTANDSTKSWTVNMDSTDVDYPAAAAKLILSLAAPSVLKAAPINVEGYESGELELTAV
ncbi:MAG TPA: hypothetical protein VF487_20305 [Chitinophagaceae bacterium]